MSESEELKINIKPSSADKFEVTIAPSAKVSELKAKIASQSGVATDQQRLIYSGKVLKDEEEIQSYKVKSGQTIHLVKGANKSQPSSSTANASSPATTQTSGSSPAQAPSNLAAGTGSGNVLADITGARYAGMAQLPSASMFGPDGGMGNMDNMASMLENPEVAAMMREMLSDPRTIDMMINSSPQLQQMGPQLREMMQNEHFRNMLLNPQTMRQTMEMQRAMGGGPPGAGGGGAFPSPGVAEDEQLQNQNANANANTDATTGANANANPAAANPFSALFGPQQGNRPQFDPSLFASMMGGAQQQQQEPQDDRPPEVRYESQLAQLNELGFYDFDRNVAALRRSGGNVQGAIEALLDGHV